MAFLPVRDTSPQILRVLSRVVRAGALAAMAVGTSTSGCGTSPTEPAAEGAGGARGRAVTGSEAYVPIPRGVHPFARPELDRGALDPEKVISNLSVVFKLTPAQVAERDALIAALEDPASPSYHQWLTPESYAARFGASPDAIARTTAWLAQQGLTVRRTSPLGARVTFSGRVADLQNALQAPMRRYEVGDQLHYAMSAAPSVPASLAGVVLGIHHTDDFYPRPMVRAGVRPGESAGTARPAYKNGHSVGLGPPDWANVYDVTKLYTQGVPGTPVVDGTGVTIGIVGVAEVGQSDIDQFRTKFGLPPTTLVTIVVPDTGTPVAGSNGGGIEAYLDTEWSGGIAKGATVDYLLSGADDPDPTAGIYYAIENNLVGILSESFGSCEVGISQSYSDIASVFGSAAELLGITYLASSGDSGADGCADFGLTGLYVDVPAAYPGVTAVGGTAFPTGSIVYDATGLAQGYGPEEVWNDHNSPVQNPGAESGGGGISNAWARPSYQSGISQCSIVGSLPTSVSPANMRQVPDLAVNAGLAETPDFVMCEIGNTGDCAASGTSDSLYAIGGTSAAAPAFAGVVALITQATGGQRLGNINPLLYTLAGTSSSAAPVFHDITQGNNEIQCAPLTDPGCPAGGLFGYAAADGYDCASGLGSIDAYNLVTAWAALAPTAVTVSAAPTTSSPGETVALLATVTVPKPNASALGGTVRFNFESYAPDGSLDLSWTFGTGTVHSGNASGGTVTLSGPIPVGLVNPSAQYVDVVAIYGGDAAHLPSTSAKTRITFSTSSSFCLAPSTGSLQPCQGFTFASTGGAAPVKWYIEADSTCDQNGNCSTLNENTGAFVAGPTPGYVVVQAIDESGVEQVAHLTVGDVADAGPPIWGDAQAPLGGCTAGLPDAGLVLSVTGACAGPDASTPLADGGSVSVDGGGSSADGGAESDGSVGRGGGGADAPVASADSGAADGGGSKGGCGCEVASSHGTTRGALASLGLGLVARLRRRRRQDRTVVDRAASASSP